MIKFNVCNNHCINLNNTFTIIGENLGHFLDDITSVNFVGSLSQGSFPTYYELGNIYCILSFSE